MPRKLKVGLSLYHVSALEDDEDEKGEVSMEEWVIRSIKRSPTKLYCTGKESRKLEKESRPILVYVVRKDSCTWGKRSSKTGDYGWIDSAITNYDRDLFNLCDYEKNGLPLKYSFSKKGAYKNVIREEKLWLKRDWYSEDNRENIRKLIRKLEGLYKRQK